MTPQLGGLAQVILVTDDLPGAGQLFGSVLGGVCYYAGYSAAEQRDAAIYAIGNLTVEPMAPAAEPGALDRPVGRFLTRFGPRLHSLAINATGVPELAARLVDQGVRVVGPGGADLATLPSTPPVSVYTHPRDTHFLVELVDFGAPFMPGSPRLRPDWDPQRWTSEHPLGFTGAWYVTALVADCAAAATRWTRLLGATVDDGSERTAADATSLRIRIGTEATVELRQPLGDATPEARALAAFGEGLHSLTLEVRDLDAAVAHLEAAGVGFASRTEATAAVDPSTAAGAALRLVASG